MKKQTLLAFAKKYYEFVYKTSPVFATFLGIHKYDCLIGDMSRRAIERNIKSFRKFKRELGIKKQELRGTSVSNWTDYQLIEADIVANLLLLEKSKDWQKNPNIYVETPLIGIFLLVSRDSITQTQRVKAVTSRLNLYPRMLEQGRTNVKNPPKVYVQIALETLDGAQHFVLTITEELQRLGPVPQKDLERLVSAVKFALTSLSSHKSYLTGLIKKGGGNFALGRRLFEQKLRHENFLDYDADQLLALGEKEFSRIEKKLGEVAQKLAPGKTWPQLVEEYRKFVPDPKNLLELYDNEVTRLVKFLKEKDLVTLPKKETCIVEETPSFERPTVPYAAYMPPAVFEKIQKGVFWVTPINENLTSEVRKEQLREHCLLSYMITTLHESYPGHHLQFCVANKSESFIRKHGQSSLLCEGWALYCEQLMAEVGYYHDPRIKVFMLKDELWRAARVIIDVSLHCFGMTIAEATKILVERVKLAPNQAEAEVKRYTMSPTQPMSYLVGKLMILEMREQAKKTWGSKFNLKRFHNSFLSCGTIPQPLIERELFRQ